MHTAARARAKSNVGLFDGVEPPKRSGSLVEALPPLPQSSSTSQVSPRPPPIRSKSYLSVTNVNGQSDDNLLSPHSPGSQKLKPTTQSPRKGSFVKLSPGKSPMTPPVIPVVEINLDPQTNPNMYPLTPHQLAVFNKLFTFPEKGLLSDGLAPPFVETTDPATYIVQCYKLDSTVLIEDYFLACTNQVYQSYTALQTRLINPPPPPPANEPPPLFTPAQYALIEKKPVEVVAQCPYFQVQGGTNGPLPFTDRNSFVAYVAAYQTSKYPLTNPSLPKSPVFHVYAKKDEEETFVYFLFSTVICDNQSASFISKEIMRLYTSTVSTMNWDHPTVFYETKEVTPFLEFVKSRDSEAEKAFPLFWQQVWVDGTDPPLSIEGYDRVSFEKRRAKMVGEMERLAVEIKTLETKKHAQESQLVFLKKQRIDIDSYSPETETFVDPVTKEEIQVTKAAKAAILFEVFGEEIVDDDIASLLKRHEVSEELQQKLGTNIQDIMALDNDQLLSMSKVSESLLEQDKVKASIERKINRLKRENADATDRLNKASHLHRNIKNEIEIRSRTVKQDWSKNKQTVCPVLGLGDAGSVNSSGSIGLGSIYSYEQFTVPTETVKRLKSYLTDLKIFRQDKQGKTMHEYLPQPWSEQFLIGMHTTLHHDFLTVGPVSQVLPVKANMNQNSLLFVDMIEKINNTIERLREVAEGSSFMDFTAKLGVVVPFTLQFAYYTQREIQMWKEAGVPLSEVLDIPGDPETQTACLLWSSNGLDTYDAKISLYEDANGGIGGFGSIALV
ncbi:hypothetical protein BCR33DRAFT_788509 [Rhizoclosmatium globosum]|uniref:Uncharacterized protein n=1 Tax=Rhizoclosmatium globosum TaxID=329046 RepID=A0A1Y2BWD8_9FUNG|nr:hypothetical protein BCR33DRAFT_788509 [Rhizoclosmatium globosum]|eukprot:ORY39071.1 hypothetical protein BCR33DRAFT_788509 [Rhizoclosmatium globosum]